MTDSTQNSAGEPRVKSATGGNPPRGASPVLAIVLVIAAIVALAVGILHRVRISLLYADLAARSRPPIEAYETIGIDLEATIVLVAVAFLWLILQVASMMSYLGRRRRGGSTNGELFSQLWFLSLLGLIGLIGFGAR